MSIPTIKIQAQTELGYMIINSTDFDPKTMIEYGTEVKQLKVVSNKKPKVTLESD